MPAKIKVKAVFLDAAHTTLELARPYPDMYRTALKDNGIERDYDRVKTVLESEWAKIEHLFNGNDSNTKINDEIDRNLWYKFYANMLETLEVSQHPEKLFSDIYAQFSLPSNWKLYPEALDTMKKLNDMGFMVGIGSNWDSNLTNILKHLGVSNHIQMEVISCKTGYRKPAPEFFKAECEVSGLEPNEIVHVGDHPIADVQGATKYGLNAVLVWRWKAPVSENISSPIIKNLSQLIDILEPA